MTKEEKLPPFLYSMLPHSWQRVEARKYSASAQCMMLHLAGFLFEGHKTEAKISYSILEKFSGLSRPTVIKACRELVDGGLITHKVENNISIFSVVKDEDFFIPNFTEMPNYFFDELLPNLSSIEIHVLCAIIKKTYGGHKAEDQISFSQLTKATGLALSTVQKAIKQLVDKGIIVSKIIDGVRAYSLILD